MRKYEPYGDEWEVEMMKLNKQQLIAMIREANTGTADKKLFCVRTWQQAQSAVEGIVNDFDAGLIDKDRVIKLMGEYTNRIMYQFWDEAVKRSSVLTGSFVNVYKDEEGRYISDEEYDSLSEAMEFVDYGVGYVETVNFLRPVKR